MVEPVQEFRFCFEEMRRVGGPAIAGFDTHFVPITDSTMNMLNWCRRASVEPRNGLCLIAGTQTHGVGQHGSWRSSPNDVKLSVMLDEVNSACGHAMINCAAAFAVQKTVTELARDYTVNLDPPPRFSVKLANDVLCRTSAGFGKISGSLAVGRHDPAIKSLLEGRDGFVFHDGLIVLGIGINLVSDSRPVVDPKFKPISLEDVTGNRIRPETAIGVLLRNLKSTLMLARDQPGMMLSAMRDLLATGDDGKVVIVRKSNDGEIRCHITALNPHGVGFTANGKPGVIPLEDIQRVVPAQKT